MNPNSGANLKILIDFIITPLLMWATAAYAGLDWVGRTEQVHRSLLGGTALVLMLVVYAYESGLKGYYRVGRRSYFLWVFLTPVALAVMGLAVGAVLKRDYFFR